MSTYTIENAEALKESDSGLSLLIEAPDFDAPEWIPHSQVHANSEVYKVGHTGDLVVTNWFAEKRGWE